jgi:hypothetical protein
VGRKTTHKAAVLQRHGCAVMVQPWCGGGGVNPRGDNLAIPLKRTIGGTRYNMEDLSVGQCELRIQNSSLRPRTFGGPSPYLIKPKTNLRLRLVHRGHLPVVYWCSQHSQPRTSSGVKRAVWPLTPPLANMRHYSLLGAMLECYSSIGRGKPRGMARMGLG